MVDPAPADPPRARVLIAGRRRHQTAAADRIRANGLPHWLADRLLVVAGVGYYVRYTSGDWGRALSVALVSSAPTAAVSPASTTVGRRPE